MVIWHFSETKITGIFKKFQIKYLTLNKVSFILKQFAVSHDQKKKKKVPEKITMAVLSNFQSAMWN